MNVLSYLWRGSKEGKASPSASTACPADAAPRRTESSGADVIASGEDVAPDTFLIKSISEPGYTGKLDRAALDRGEQESASAAATGDAEVSECMDDHGRHGIHACVCLSMVRFPRLLVHRVRRRRVRLQCRAPPPLCVMRIVTLT